MLGWIAATTGGLIKDVVVSAEKAWDVVTDEISSIPDAFGQGLEHGLFTGPDVDEEIVDLDHHVDTEESIASKHVELPKFGTRHSV